MDHNKISAMFPFGFRILLIDHDRVTLTILSKQLRSCLYKVTLSRSSSDALALLQYGNEFDLVLSAVHMPEIDGFELLEQIGIEMNIPFVMMSANDDEDLVRKGIMKGACDYLIKPVPFDKLKNIWQHAVQKKLNTIDCLTTIEPIVEEPQKPSDEICTESSKKRKEEDQKREREAEQKTRNATPLKRSKRLAWSDELKKQFEEAVNILGVDKAVPKKILEYMNNPELKRENVASRLQKYRLSLKKPCKRTQKKNEPVAPIMIPSQTDFSSVTSYNGVDVQGLSISDLPHMPSLSTQMRLRNPFSSCTQQHYMPGQLPYFHQSIQTIHNMGMHVGEETLKFSDSPVPDENSIGHLESYGRHTNPFMTYMGQQVYGGGLAYNLSVPQPYPKIPVMQFPEHSLGFIPTPQMLHNMGSSATIYYHEAHQNLDAAYEAMPVTFEASSTSFVVPSKKNGENIDVSIGSLQLEKEYDENLEGKVQGHHTALVSDIKAEKLFAFNDDSSTLIAFEGHHENAANSLLR